MPVARTLWNRRIPANDGIELAADVFLPPGPGPFPTVVLRTPYARSRALNNPAGWIRLVDAGYALVSVDVRGRGDSDGEWIPWARDLQDAHDVIEWAAAQAWSTAKVGMVSGSYEGRTQWWTAASRPKHLACIAPQCIGGVTHARPFGGTGIPIQYRLWWMALVLGRTYQFPGAIAWEARMDATPLRTLDEVCGIPGSAWQGYVSGEVEAANGALSQQEFAEIDVPVLVTVGWWDDQETMLVWQALQRARSAGECRLLIGPWDHAGNTAPRPILGGLDVSAGCMDIIGYTEKFLALHLKGERNEMAGAPRCRVFLTGENRWDELSDWPLPQARTHAMYLDSNGDACGLKGSGRLGRETAANDGADSFEYDPNQPGRDMSNLAVFAWADPPLDSRYLQRRLDTVVYTSEPLDAALMVSGQYQVCLFVSSDSPDTDLFAFLSDVHPDGRAISLSASNEPPACLRLRYRNGPTAEPLLAGAIYEVSIDGTWMHHVFRPGHRIRLQISSSNFPMMARNAGTGEHWAEDRVLRKQRNTIHHSSRYPSRLLLPVVARGAA